MSGIRPRRQGETDPDVLGIAYLLTATEYERLLRSEGGRHGGYLEIDVRVTALLNLTTHPGDEIACKSLQTRSPREDPRPFPSKRYITLIRTGAKAHRFPGEYQTYLEDLPFYQVRGWWTAVGRVVFLTIWLPFILFIFALMKASESLSPGQLKWLRKLQEWTFLAMWKMHDSFFAWVFGRGDISGPGEGLAHGEEEK